MKKWIAILCVATVMLSAAACGQSDQPAQSSIEQLISQELSGEITVSCYDTMAYKEFLEMAAKSFEAANPGTTINVETFAAMPEVKTSQSGGKNIQMMEKVEDSQEKSDYINKINTELMGGGGADVLAMDILPYYKYADSGQLEDLKAYMDADDSFRKSDYRENIIDALQYKGGQYVLPLDYEFQYLAYDSSLFTEEEEQDLHNDSTFSYEQLFEAAKEPFKNVNAEGSEVKRIFGAPAYTGQRPNMFSELFLENYDAFIDIENRTVHFTDGGFAELLKTIKEYDEKGYLKPSSSSAQFQLGDLEKNIAEQFFYKTKKQFSLLTEALKGTGMKMMLSFGSMSAGNEDNDKTLGNLQGKNGNVNFSYTQAYGINANSDNKALAWAFVKYMMGEEMQSSLQLSRTSLPVHNAARKEKAEMGISGELFAQGKGNTSGELNESQQKALDQYLETTEKLSDALNYCPIEDTTINSMIDSEAAYYFSGSKTAEEVANALQSKIELYLNE